MFLDPALRAEFISFLLVKINTFEIIRTIIYYYYYTTTK